MTLNESLTGHRSRTLLIYIRLCVTSPHPIHRICRHKMLMQTDKLFYSLLYSNSTVISGRKRLLGLVMWCTCTYLLTGTDCTKYQWYLLLDWLMSSWSPFTPSGYHQINCLCLMRRFATVYISWLMKWCLLGNYVLSVLLVILLFNFRNK